MSMLIGDAGGTSIEWRYIDNDKNITQFKTLGFNASINPIIDLKTCLAKLVNIETDEVVFYGAGILSELHHKEIEDTFKSSFNNLQKVSINSDLIGAARALYTEGGGAVGILGTGSAGFIYDGKNISHKMPSLGFLLGNEGSGYDIGKHFLRSLLRKDFTSSTSEKVKKQQPWFSEVELLSRIHRTKSANALIADYSYLAKFCLIDPAVWNMVYNRFSVYLNNYFKNHKPERIRFVGSVAFEFQDILKEACTECNIPCDIIIQSPIAGLTLYHLKNE